MKHLIVILTLLTSLTAQQDKTILIALTVTDIITTEYILNTGGIEGNPIAGMMVGRPNVYVGLRLIVTVYYINCKPSKRQTLILNSILGLFVVNNLWQINKKEIR